MSGWTFDSPKFLSRESSWAACLSRDTCFRRRWNIDGLMRDCFSEVLLYLTDSLFVCDCSVDVWWDFYPHDWFLLEPIKGDLRSLSPKVSSFTQVSHLGTWNDAISLRLCLKSSRLTGPSFRQKLERRLLLSCQGRWGEGTISRSRARIRSWGGSNCMKKSPYNWGREAVCARIEGIFSEFCVGLVLNLHLSATNGRWSSPALWVNICSLEIYAVRDGEICDRLIPWNQTHTKPGWR